ncbi:glycosyltransferase family 39 protein [bacterium]|nr:glycosyltransferase family 39 protein [bacterium]
MSKDRRFGTWLFISSSLAALALRLVYMFQVRDATLFKAPLRDSAFYVARAWEILHGDIVGHAVSFHSAPIYPYFIGAVMGIVGEDQGLWWLRLTQAMISALTAGLLSLTALRLFGRWAGVATALLTILHGPFLFYSG